MKLTNEELLHSLKILPLSNDIWEKFDISLFSDSTVQEYDRVKKVINHHVSQGFGGIYIIAKEDKILYIGESEKSIRNRLRRHIAKIYIRTDPRSLFFKLPEHQGNLTIYFWALPLNLLDKRRIIEDLLTNALEPEHKKWEVKNEIKDLTQLFTQNSESLESRKNQSLLDMHNQNKDSKLTSLNKSSMV